MSKRIFFCILGFFVVMAHGQMARADRRIVVLNVEGAQSRHLRDSVAALLLIEHKVLGQREWDQKAGKLRATKKTARNMARVARALKADGILAGTFSPRPDGGYTLKLTLRSGKTGKVVDTFTLALKYPGLSDKMKEQLGADLAAAIDRLPGGKGRKQVKEEPENPKKPGGRTGRAQEDDAGEDDAGKDAAPGRDGEDGEDGGDDGDGDDGDSDVEDLDDDSEDDEPEDMDGDAAFVSDAGRDDGDRVAARPSRSGLSRFPAGATVHVGASVVLRDLTFTTDPVDFAEAPQNYDGPVSPGVYARGEVYPMAFVTGPQSLWAKVGVGFEVDRVLGLQTAIANGGNVTLVPTTQMHYSLDVRVRHSFGPRLPTVEAFAGMGSLAFELDVNARPFGVQLDVPNTTYSFFDPGLGVRVPVTDRVTLTAAGRLLLITDTGEIQEREHYGAATLTALSLDAGVDVLATERVLVRVSGAYTSVAFAFKGTGEQTYLRDGDERTQDVVGASDRYLGSVVSVGYLF